MSQVRVLVREQRFSRNGLAVKVACAAANDEITVNAIKKGVRPKLISTFTPGRIRHTVASNAINSGADPAQVSASLNHKNPRTTRKFYATHAVATKIPTPL